VGHLEDVSISLWLFAAGVKPVHVPSLASSEATASPGFLAVANMRKLQSFLDIDVAVVGFTADSPPTQADDTPISVFLSPEAIYSVHLIDRLLRSTHNRPAKFRTDSLSSLYTQTARLDVLVLSPNDFLSGSDSCWGTEHQAALEILVRSASAAFIIFISGEALDLSGLLDSGLRLNVVVTATKDARLLPSTSGEEGGAPLPLCEGIECWPRAPLQSSSPSALYIPVAAVAFAEMVRLYIKLLIASCEARFLES